MSYLQLDTGLADFSMAVISFWFRVPQSSVDLVRADSDARNNPLGNDNQFIGVIPLVSFGATGTVFSYDNFTPERNFTAQTSPSFVGVWCPSNFAFRPPDHVGLCWRAQYTTGGGWVSDPVPSSTNDPQGNVSMPDCFQIGGPRDAAPYLFALTNRASYITVTPDHWHHVLISFDLSNGSSQVTLAGEGDSVEVGFGDYCKFWWAVDDRNYDGDSLAPAGLNSYAPYSNDPNGIVSAFSTNYAATWIPGFFPAGDIPTSGFPLGIPSGGNFVQYVYPVEMAELQVFTGVTLDTSVTGNRRAFITAAGTPADPLKKPNPPPPVPLPPGWVPPAKGPQELLGKEADILLHGSGNWINGKNTGKVIKLSEIGKPSSVPAAQLKPTGSIVSYSPDPSLHGAQSPPPPRPPLR